MIEHLQVRLRRAHQRAADAEAQSAQGQLEEQTAILQKACERVEQLEDANSQLQACSVSLLICSSHHDGNSWSLCRARKCKNSLVGKRVRHQVMFANSKCSGQRRLAASFSTEHALLAWAAYRLQLFAQPANALEHVQTGTTCCWGETHLCASHDVH